MRYRTKLFIDFWNFQLNWNSRVEEAKCDWRKLPIVFKEESQRVISSVLSGEDLTVDETRLYASANLETDKKLKHWLESVVNMFPTYKVCVKERSRQKKPVHCTKCGYDIIECPNCGGELKRATEKGVDAQIVTDMLSLAWEDAYQVAILVSSDGDFVPAVERLSEKGIKIINAAWHGMGYNLRHACWASFDIHDVSNELIRL